MKKIVIAIDGFAGCGKSTTAKLVAQQLGYVYVDSGAMYRAITLFLLRKGIPLSDEVAVKDALKHIRLHFEQHPETGLNEMYLNGENVEGSIRSLEVSQAVSGVSAQKAVRQFLLDQQRELGEGKGIVMDGRDIGTVIFPQAELKVFMTASNEVRALRRQAELAAKGEQVPLADILANLVTRDQIDTTRAESPLRKADDAREVDTSGMTIPDQVDAIVQMAKNISGRA